MSCGCAPQVPTCLPPQATLFFFKGAQGDTGPAGPAGPVGPAGAQGIQGPIGTYTGQYNGTGTYYSSGVRRDVVAWDGEYWVAVNSAKDGLATWGVPGVSSDWTSVGTTFASIATGLALIGIQTITVGLVLETGAYISSENYVANVSGALINDTGFAQFQNMVIIGEVATPETKINPANGDNQFPWIGNAAYVIPSVASAGITVSATPATGGVVQTDNSLIFFGWDSGAAGLLQNRFGYSNQTFLITVEGQADNQGAGTQRFLAVLAYRTRNNGGAWSLWTAIGRNVEVMPLPAMTPTGQSFTMTLPLTVALTGTEDIQFGLAISKSAAATMDFVGGYIAALAYN